MKCLLDLDGVLVDFVGGICRAHGRPNPYADGQNNGLYEMAELWGISATKFWSVADAEFWAGLEMMPDGTNILTACVDVFGTENICLLTSPSMNEGATEGKVRWIYEHLPVFRRRFMVGAAKEFCAHPGAVLVDDYDSNVAKFRLHGGHAVLVPRPWNSAHAKSRNVWRHLVDELSPFLRQGAGA